jgi:hypothetical protein
MAAKNAGLEHSNPIIVLRAPDLDALGRQKFRAAMAKGSVNKNKQYFLQTLAAETGFG